MKRIYVVAALFLGSISLTSCTRDQEPATPAYTNNVLYLHSLVTKTDNPTNTFNNLIKQGNVVVDFYADWCGPCKTMSSVIGQIAPQYPNVTFLKINTDTFPGIASGIRSIPTVVFYKNGQQVYRQSSALNQQSLVSLLQKFYA